MLALLSACTHGEGTTSARDSLVIGRIGDFESLNPLLLSGADSASIGPLVFSYLVTVDSRGILAPDVAQAVPSVANGGISRDGKTIVYRLRKGVRWQDGAPLTSRDVAFTYRQILNPRNDVPARDVYDRIVRLETPDPWTVRLTLREPNSAMLSYFFAPDGNYTILPEHVLRGRTDLNHDPFNAMPVGSGPFRVVEWRRGDRLRLERFDGYFGGVPGLRENHDRRAAVGANAARPNADARDRCDVRGQRYAAGRLCEDPRRACGARAGIRRRTARV